MRAPTRSVTAAALAAVVAFGLPAGAHSPRDAKPGGPRMDLEVLVTPPLSGRVTPGGTDAVVSVDAFGNRFALARKESAARLVGVDPRARAMVRSSYWQWMSADEGATWENLETLPRGADAFLPEGDAFDIASHGPTTYLASATPTGTVVTTVVASGRGKITSIEQSLIASARGLGGGLQLAPFNDGVFLVSAQIIGTAVHKVEATEAGAGVGSSVDGADCGAAAAGTSPRVRVVLVCREAGSLVQHTSVDDGRTFTRRVLGEPDTRAGGSGSPAVDMTPDGTAYVLSGTRMWRIRPSGGTTLQDVRSEGGDHVVTTLGVSARGRVGIAAYRKSAAGTWNVVVTIFTPGRTPVWSDFAAHDPVSPAGASAPSSGRVSLDFDEQGRIQVLWTSSHLHSQELDQPVLRNVWAVRSVTS